MSKTLQHYDEAFLTDTDRIRIAQIVEAHYPSLIERFPPEFALAPKDSLTGRSSFFNFLAIPEMRQILLPKLKEKVKALRPDWSKCVIQCWANTFFEGKGIGWHQHSDRDTDFLVMHIFIDGEGTSTLYLEPDGSVNQVRNVKGALSVTYPKTYHTTTPNLGGSVRVSIAVDIHPESDPDYQNLLLQPWRYIETTL